MITINQVTVRLGGHTILDRATAAIPPGAHVGLIGRLRQCHQLRQRRLVGRASPHGHDVGARLREAHGDRLAQAGVGAGDEGDLALQAEQAPAHRSWQMSRTFMSV